MGHVEQAPAWVPCQCEPGVYWCSIHEEHAHDCKCPPIDEWEVSPYHTRGPRPIPRLKLVRIH